MPSLKDSGLFDFKRKLNFRVSEYHESAHLMSLNKQFQLELLSESHKNLSKLIDCVKKRVSERVSPKVVHII